MLTETKVDDILQKFSSQQQDQLHGTGHDERNMESYHLKAKNSIIWGVESSLHAMPSTAKQSGYCQGAVDVEGVEESQT